MGGQRKIKIAIATRKMVMGGIEKSLIELLKELLRNDCEVTLYLEELEGELYRKIPKGVNVVHIFKEYISMFEILKRNLRVWKLKKIEAVVRSYLCVRFNGDPVKGWKEICNYMDVISEDYDYAFAYGAPISFSTVFVERILEARRKYAWIHNDVTQISLDVRKYRDIFRKYEKIICVSQNAKKMFNSLLPEFQDKSIVFYNILNKNEILEYAKESIFLDNYMGTRIVTVGRISYEKGQDIIPDIVQKLLKNGYNVRWYCVGDGEGRKDLQKRITTMSLDKHIILLGNCMNPYPFFKAADIYIQPSRNEGFGITIAEAKVFRVPIITTNFVCADEHIIDGETGYIVNFDVDEICDRIIALLEDRNIGTRFKNNLCEDKKSCISKMELLLD